MGFGLVEIFVYLFFESVQRGGKGYARVRDDCERARAPATECSAESSVADALARARNHPLAGHLNEADSPVFVEFCCGADLEPPFTAGFPLKSS